MWKIVIIVVVIGGLLAYGGFKWGVGGFGTGGGSGKGTQILNAITEEKKDESSQKKNEEVIIKVEEDKIYVAEEECKDVEDLKEKIKIINANGESKKYFFEYEYAIKATYDEVRKALFDLEETLGISISDKG